MSDFTRTFKDRLREAEKKLGIEHLNGVAWHEVPRPPLFHRHWAQTTSPGTWRCPCGAFGGPGEPWVSLDPRSVRWWPPFGRRRSGVGGR